MIQALINITVIEGENSSLTFHVSGTPMPSVSWTEVRTGDRTEGSIRSPPTHPFTSPSKYRPHKLVKNTKKSTVHFKKQKLVY